MKLTVPGETSVSRDPCFVDYYNSPCGLLVYFLSSGIKARVYFPKFREQIKLTDTVLSSLPGNGPWNHPGDSVKRNWVPRDARSSKLKRIPDVQFVPRQECASSTSLRIIGQIYGCEVGNVSARLQRGTRVRAKIRRHSKRERQRERIR